MGYSLTFEIPTRATDSNKVLRGNKFAHSQVFQRIKKEVYFLTLGKVPEKPLTKFKLSITRHGARTLDYDNLIASFKPFIDGLKVAQIIEDDNWNFIRQINTDQKTGKERKLVITVEDCSDSRMATKEELASLRNHE